jgi:hypothetical protein
MSATSSQPISNQQPPSVNTLNMNPLLNPSYGNLNGMVNSNSIPFLGDPSQMYSSMNMNNMCTSIQSAATININLSSPMTPMLQFNETPPHPIPHHFQQSTRAQHQPFHSSLPRTPQPQPQSQRRTTFEDRQKAKKLKAQFFNNTSTTHPDKLFPPQTQTQSQLQPQAQTQATSYTHQHGSPPCPHHHHNCPCNFHNSNPI